MSSEFRLGIIADTQYSDSEDGTTFDKTSIRRYRHSLVVLEKSIEHFNDNDIDYCVQLGDVLDSRTLNLNIETKCLEEVLALTNGSNLPWSFCVGNHDLASISRDCFHQNLIPPVVQSICNPNKLYYDISPCSGYRFLFLDGYDISTIAPTSEEHREQAHSLLHTKNKNIAEGNHDWFQNIAVEDFKYVPYNGAIGTEQLNWIRNTLYKAKTNSERCIIFSHMPIYGACCRPSGIIWNSDELMAVLHEPELRGVTVAVLSGHDHDGGYAVDHHGIHHIVPPAPLECEVGQCAYGFISLPVTGSTADNRNSVCGGSGGDDESVSRLAVVGETTSEKINNSASSVDGEASAAMMESSSTIGEDNTGNCNYRDYMKLHWVGKLPVSDPHNWPSVMAFPEYTAVAEVAEAVE